MKNPNISAGEIRPQRRAASAQAGLQLPLGMALLGVAPGALECLRKLTVAIVGCGSVGGRIAILLARMGLEALFLVDPKQYKPVSLATHDIAPVDVGRSKAQVVGHRCKAISPGTRVVAWAQPIEAIDLSALAGASLLVMAPDLLAVEVELAQRCMWLGQPLVHAAVHGATLTAQIRFFQNALAQGACPGCCYGQTEWDLLSRQVRFSCDGAPVAAASSQVDVPRTNSVSGLASLCADLAFVQIIRFFLKLGQPVENTMLEYCGFTHRTVVSPIPRDPNCRLDHTAFKQVTLDIPLLQLSLAELTQRATGAAIPTDAQFEVAGVDWVEFAACGCAQLSPVRQFVCRGRAELSRCRKCSRLRIPHNFYTHRAVSTAVLGGAAEQSLHKLGARRVTSVLLRTSDTGVLIRAQSPSPCVL